jgi:hypothetical protein
MKKIILVILTVFLVTGFLVVDSQAGYYRKNRTYWSGPAVIVSPQPYRTYYYPPAPVVIRRPAPVVYLQPPWLSGISVFLPGINIRIR